MTGEARRQVSSSVIYPLLLLMTGIFENVQLGFAQKRSDSPTKQRHGQYLAHYRSEIRLVQGWLDDCLAFERERRRVEQEHEAMMKHYAQQETTRQEPCTQTVEDSEQYARDLQSMLLAKLRQPETEAWIEGVSSMLSAPDAPDIKNDEPVKDPGSSSPLSVRIKSESGSPGIKGSRKSKKACMKTRIKTEPCIEASSSKRKKPSPRWPDPSMA